MGQSDAVGTAGVVVLAMLFSAALVTFGYAAVTFWPADCPNNLCTDLTVQFFGKDIKLHRAENLLIIVCVSGTIGALIHAGSSVAEYVGNRQLVWSWVWWLVFRLPVGGALALVFYLLVRGGLLIPNGTTEPQINPYGVAGLAALVGMFAKQATDKLAEIFDTLFRSSKDNLRLDPLKSRRDANLPSQDIAVTTAGMSVTPGDMRDEQ